MVELGKRAKKLRKAAPMLKSAVSPMLTGKVKDWHGEYAYSIGLQAFIYGFPYIYNAQVRQQLGHPTEGSRNSFRTLP